VRQLQADACMFSDAGPEVRWVGNEAGIAGDPCWATLNVADFYPGDADEKRLNSGDRPGTHWLPPECDVSIRPGWFYHASEDSKVKTPDKLLDLYYKSVGRGGSFLINLPPDRRGLLHENDVKAIGEFGKRINATFSINLAKDAKITASNTRGNDMQFAPANLLDDKRSSYWSPDDAILTPEVTLELKQPVTFNVVSVREFLPLGQRIEAWALDRWEGGKWVEFAKGESIGNRRLWRGAPITTQQVRLRIVKAAASPALSEFGLFAEPAPGGGTAANQ